MNRLITDEDREDYRLQELERWREDLVALRASRDGWVDAHDRLLAENQRMRGVLARIGTPWTPELREQLIRTFDMRYEELSEDLYDDGDGTMSIREKEERSMAAALGVFRWWLVSGEVAHHRDALAALARQNRYTKDAPAVAQEA